MTLHLLKHPINALALQVLDSKTPNDALIAVLLSPEASLPITGVKVYRISYSSSPENAQNISYDRLIEMIFAADKVIAW